MSSLEMSPGLRTSRNEKFCSVFINPDAYYQMIANLIRQHQSQSRHLARVRENGYLPRSCMSLRVFRHILQMIGNFWCDRSKLHTGSWKPCPTCKDYYEDDEFGFLGNIASPSYLSPASPRGLVYSTDAPNSISRNTFSRDAGIMFAKENASGALSSHASKVQFVESMCSTVQEHYVNSNRKKTGQRCPSLHLPSG